MEALQVENKVTTNLRPPLKMPQTKVISIEAQNTHQSFYDKSQLIKNFYTFIEDDINTEQKIIGLVLFHDLIDFLFWVHQPIVDIFGNVEKTLHLSKCWDEEEYHLVLTIYSGLDDMDELTRLEDELFERFDSYHAIDHALHYITFSQR